MAIRSVFAVIDENGISAPTYDEIVEYYKTEYRKIYGEDVYLENDSQDGQWIGVQALAVHDCNTTFIDLYNSFSPNTAQHDALIRNVKINNIKLQDSSKSTVELQLMGVAGTVIRNGVVLDINNNRWLLPSVVTIEKTGLALVTATAEREGVVIASTNTITNIVTPTRGWQSATNLTSANLGSPIETDLKLRQRQALSTSNSALSLSEAIRGSILALKGVTRCKTFENKTSQRDENGLAPHSFCAVVHGGDAQQIAQVIKSKKTIGCNLHGNTSVSLLNIYGEFERFTYYRADVISVSYAIQLASNDAYSAETTALIKNLLAEYTNDLGIGDKITKNKVIAVSNLNGSELNRTYEVVDITIKANNVAIQGDYSLAFGAVAFCDPSTIEVEIVSG